MNGRHRKPATWAIYVVSIALAGAGALAVAGHAYAQPVLEDPAVPVTPTPAPPMQVTIETAAPQPVPGEVPPPPPAPVPPGAPYVPPVPRNEALQQPGGLGLIRELWNLRNPNDLMNALFPAPAYPVVPPRDMPMGPPPPLDPPLPPSP
jgi:hypothetical protein